MKTTDWSSTPQVTTSTTTSSWYNVVQPQQGWECPRCHKINAPWVPQCNCTEYKSNLYYTSITNQDQLGAINNNNKKTPYSITLDDPSITVGGSDYKIAPNTYINVSRAQSNKIDTNTTTTAWNNEPSTQTIHNGKINYKE